jgi:hypothetical protein
MGVEADCRIGWAAGSRWAARRSRGLVAAALAMAMATSMGIAVHRIRAGHLKAVTTEVVPETAVPRRTARHTARRMVGLAVRGVVGVVGVEVDGPRMFLPMTFAVVVAVVAVMVAVAISGAISVAISEAISVRDAMGVTETITISVVAVVVDTAEATAMVGVDTTRPRVGMETEAAAAAAAAEVALLALLGMAAFMGLALPRAVGTTRASAAGVGAGVVDVY